MITAKWIVFNGDVLYRNGYCFLIDHLWSASLSILSHSED